MAFLPPPMDRERPRSQTDRERPRSQTDRARSIDDDWLCARGRARSTRRAVQAYAGGSMPPVARNFSSQWMS